MRLQGYFKVNPNLVSQKQHGMVAVEIEMLGDPGMTLDVIGSAKILHEFADGDFLIIGAYSRDQYEDLDGMLPESFVCLSREELMVLHPELDVLIESGDGWSPSIPDSRFAQ